ncbi:probable monooxygenase [marine gamma proteobacterium HTCC2143]|jgi:4-hydroxyacetophenone monooxygenase|uniref:Probable monooxygenase n=1 Tax=marine gamma proteobacterium HTCC2143 TaxID=247633 RepID=A0YFX2_9GAMM|nr:probable monooxygenase [marine gamma proteobacterium HTCC2143]
MQKKFIGLSKAQISSAIESADLRVLLMVIFHLTGDKSWLQEPYLPSRDVRLIADESAGFSEHIQAVIRAEAVKLLSAEELTAVVEDPGDELMLTLMQTCLGERIPAEYAPMMREQMGFCSPLEDIPVTASSALKRKPVVIVGAGVSGLAMGTTLKQLNIPFIIVEKNAEVGGTWWQNRYPGCGVDTPNHAYSFSFGERYRWDRYFAPREQLQDYMQHTATAMGLRPSIRLQTEFKKARWNEQKQCWDITISDSQGTEEIEAVALVTAIGQLSLPAIPVITGIKDFAGTIFHTANWPSGLDLKGKRVAIVGTGASAMQIVPTIADDVSSLTIYQRGAQWARPIPRYHDSISEDGQWLLEKVPFYAAWFRFAMFWRYGDGLLPSLHKDPEWAHPERSLNRSNDRHRQEMTDYIVSSLGDRDDLVEKCLPDYPPYGKRILLDNGWYDTLRKPQVELVTDKISHVDSGGVHTQTGDQREADIIILSTGFQVGLLSARLDIVGRDGTSLEHHWGPDNPKAHLGINVAGFPNLFCTQGPNTGLGHGGSAIFQSECQAKFIGACLARMNANNISSIDIKQDAQDQYVARVDAEHEKMIWTHPGMSTYYRNEAGRVVSVMPWRLVDYWKMTSTPNFDDFRQTVSSLD